jgi:uncharacterized protein YbjT (DUF2867 family)
LLNLHTVLINGKIHKIMKAVLIGGSGLVGGALLQKLVADTAFSSVVLVSRQSLLPQPPNVEEHLINFDNETAFRGALAGADVLFCCVGTTQKKVKGDKNAYRKVDFGIPVMAARLSAELGLSHYILVSAAGANAASRNFYLQLKGETETAVRSQSIRSIYVMRPSVLLGRRREQRPAESIAKAIMQFFSFVLIGRAQQYKPIAASTVAGAMLAASKKTSGGVFVCGYGEMMALATGG